MEEKRVLFTVSNLKIMSAKHLLAEAGIQAFTINKMDSAHAGVFGHIELYVDASEEVKARTILQENDMI